MCWWGQVSALRVYDFRVDFGVELVEAVRGARVVELALALDASKDVCEFYTPGRALYVRDLFSERFDELQALSLFLVAVAGSTSSLLVAVLTSLIFLTSMMSRSAERLQGCAAQA